MADLGRISSLINSFPVELRPPMLRLFQAFLKDLRFGHSTGSQPDPLMNFAGGFFQATTPHVAGTEFSIAHGFGRTPYLAVPCLPLDQVGASVVPLQVTRAADANRIYLSSTFADTAFTIMCEG